MLSVRQFIVGCRHEQAVGLALADRHRRGKRSVALLDRHLPFPAVIRLVFRNIQHDCRVGQSLGSLVCHPVLACSIDRHIELNVCLHFHFNLLGIVGHAIIRPREQQAIRRSLCDLGGYRFLSATERQYTCPCIVILVGITCHRDFCARAFFTRRRRHPAPGLIGARRPRLIGRQRNRLCPARLRNRKGHLINVQNRFRLTSREKSNEKKYQSGTKNGF